VDAVSARERAPVELAQGQLDAYNARDLEGFLSFYAEDCVVRDLPGGAARIEGRAAMAERYGALFASSPDLHARLEGRLECGAFVVDRERVVRRRGEPERLALAIYRCAGGLIREVWFPPVVEAPPPSP
jgi:hypothetical protein